MSALGAIPVGDVTVTFDWVPEPEVVAMEIFRLAGRLEDRSVPLQLSRQIAADDTREHFEKQESPDGAAWAPWADSYAPKALATNAGKILQRTYDLQNAVTDLSAYPATDDSVFFNAGVMEPYGFMNYYGSGGTIHLREGESHPSFAGGAPAAADIRLSGEGTGHALPARPMVGISDEAAYQILEVFEAWFAGTVNTAFVRGGRVVGGFRGPGGRFAKQG